VSKQSTHSESFKEKEKLIQTATNVSAWPPLGNFSTPPSIVEENIPLIVDVETFQYMYRCGHCGHQWLEVHEKDKSGPEPRGYTGD